MTLFRIDTSLVHYRIGCRSVPSADCVVFVYVTPDTCIRAHYQLMSGRAFFYDKYRDDVKCNEKPTVYNLMTALQRVLNVNE